MNGFLKRLSKIINRGESRSVILTGNIYDLFFNGQQYVPLVNLLSDEYSVKATKNKRGVLQVIYELNKPIVLKGEGVDTFKKYWKLHRSGDFDDNCKKANGSATFALEFMRQMTELSRENKDSLTFDLVVIIEGADFIVPDGEIIRLNMADRKRISILHDWLSDPAFAFRHDSVILISESRSLVHSRVSKLPQVMSVEVPSPDLEARTHYLRHVCSDQTGVAELTAGLSIHALRQIVKSGDVTSEKITDKVENFITAQLGEGVVEFKRPCHKLDKVVGFSQIKTFFREELIPGFQARDETALSGCAFSGPIGGGKTFLGEAVAAELGIPVMVLKNLRSQWFGQTDVIFERLRRTLTALDKVCIFIDEADTVFGKISGEGHATEKRLTGGIQAMMSDPRLRGKVHWLLMTARIHLLSPDVRRPGRVGDLIVPILDPQDKDAEAFREWALDSVDDDIEWGEFHKLTQDYSAAAYAALRSRIKAKDCQTWEDVKAIAEDLIPPDIEEERQLQTLYALLNCTRRSLLPDNKEDKKKWKREVRELERTLS